MANAFKLRQQWHISSSPSQPAPLVVVLPWVWADSKYTSKYVELAVRSGWDVLTANWPMQAMWFPLWTHRLALSLLETVGSKLIYEGERPVVFWAFSGSAKGVFASLLSILSGQHSLSARQTEASTMLRRCCCGVIYDSCPVDFNSEVGKKLLAPGQHSSVGSSRSSSSSLSTAASARLTSSSSADSQHAARAAAVARQAADAVAGWSVGLGAGVLDFFLMEWFDKDREAMWCSLENPPVHGPFLFLYSRSDELADAGQISGLANTLRQRGHHVVEQVWQDTPHCGHYRYHPQQYEESVSYFFSQALQQWTDSRDRLLEGQQLAARWMDQEPEQRRGDVQPPPPQQQQQQQLMRQPTRGIAGGPSSGPSSSTRQQQQQPSPAAQAVRCSSSGTDRAMLYDQLHSRRAAADAAHSIGQSRLSNSLEHCSSQQRQCSRSTTGCCCSSDALAAATIAAVAGAAPARSATKQAHHTNTTALPDNSSNGGRSRVARAAGHWSAASLAAATAAAAVSSGAAGHSSISTCCGCAGSECRCAETLAAASGEVVCSDSTTLAHSLRCMASSYLGRHQEQQQQQEEYLVQAGLGQPRHSKRWQPQQQGGHHHRGYPNAGASLELQSTSSISSSGTRGPHCTDESCLGDVWVQQQREQQQQEFMQRVVTRLRSRL